MKKVRLSLYIDYFEVVLYYGYSELYQIYPRGVLLIVCSRWRSTVALKFDLYENFDHMCIVSIVHSCEQCTSSSEYVEYTTVPVVFKTSLHIAYTSCFTAAAAMVYLCVRTCVHACR
jgi:hypothetical protein